MTEIDPEVAPYLHPDYWDGHSLGIGEAEPWPYPLSDPGTWLKVSRIVREYLHGRTSRFPLEVFRDGDVFDPSGQIEGTIALFKQETLTGRPRVEINYDNIEDLEPPLKDPNIPPGFTYPQLMGKNLGKLTDHIRYMESINWGVVLKDKSGENALVHIDAGLLLRQQSGRVWTLSPARQYAEPIEIGRTHHFHAKNGAERLERILRLEVCGYAKPQEQRETRWGWLGRLATGDT